MSSSTTPAASPLPLGDLDPSRSARLQPFSTFGLTALIFAAVLVVLAGSSSIAGLAGPAYELRFVMYAALIFFAFTGSNQVTNVPAVGVPAALVACALGSVVWSAFPSLSAQRSIGFALLILAGAMLAGRRWVSELIIRQHLAAIVAGVVLFLGIGLLYLVIDPSIALSAVNTVGTRYRGLLGSPNTIGVVAAVALPLIAGLWRSTRHPIERLIWIVSGAAVAASLALSQSRGGLLAAAVGVTVYVLADRGLRRGQIAGLVVGALVAAGSFFVVVPQLEPDTVRDLQTRFLSGQTGSQGGSGRLAAWRLATDVWMERPVTGWGFGTADAVFGPRSIEIQQVFQGQDPHNSLFSILVELGLVGVLLLTASLVAGLIAAIRGARSPMGAALAGALTAAVTTNLFESGLTAPGSVLGFLYWMAFFMSVRLYALTRAQRSERTV